MFFSVYLVPMLFGYQNLIVINQIKNEMKLNKLLFENKLSKLKSLILKTKKNI